MKIRNRLLLRLIGMAGSLVLRAWIGSLRREIIFQSPEHNPLSDACTHNQAIVIWHENLLLAAYLLAKVKQYTIISNSNDGEYIARIVEQCGLKVIRGSSSRGAVTAVRKLIRAAVSGERVHIGITTDGPRGPRRHLKPGAVYLASKAGMVVMPVGIAFDRPWRAKSWDQFALPRPFSRAVAVGAPPIHLGNNLSREELARVQQQVQETLDRVQAEAERLVSGKGRPQAVPDETRQAA